MLGTAGLHEPRAGARPPGRSQGRRLVAGRRALRDADRHPAISWEQPSGSRRRTSSPAIPSRSPPGAPICRQPSTTSCAERWRSVRTTATRRCRPWRRISPRSPSPSRSAVRSAGSRTSSRTPRADEATAIAAGAERRWAAVVVQTVSDYSALVERLSPGELETLLGDLRRAAAEVVQRHGGIVNQAIGDEIVSLFGVPDRPRG